MKKDIFNAADREVIERQYAINYAREQMEQIIAAHESQIRDLKRYIARFDQAVIGTAAGDNNAPNPIEVMSWFMNATRNLGANMRVDLMVSAAARLAVAMEGVK